MKPTHLFTTALLCLSVNSFAAVRNCTEPAFAEIKEVGDGVYRFPVVMSCEVTEISKPNFMELFTRHLNEVKSKAETVHSETGNETHKKLDLTKSYQSSDGFIRTRDEVTLKTDKTSQFDQWELSKDIIKTTNNMKYTKRVYVVTNVKLNETDPTKLTVKVSQVIDIEKPTFAPRSFFIKEAKKGLVTSTKELAEKESKQASEIMSAN